MYNSPVRVRADKHAACWGFGNFCVAKNTLGTPALTITLEKGALPKQWRLPSATAFLPVERAALAHFEREGWRGYWGEGGLILNLIKAMSFPIISLRHRCICTEALYAQNVAFQEDRFDVEVMLSQVAKATPAQIASNYKRMVSREAHSEKGTVTSGVTWTSVSTQSMLDHFPHLELWMFLELHAALGNKLLRHIAGVFATDPYTLRGGWPDLTIWKSDQVRFVEVKAPGDKRQPRQRVLFDMILKPLSLDVVIANVVTSAVQKT
jgi:hypothetical protein